MNITVKNFYLVNTLDKREIINTFTGESAPIHFTVTDGYFCEFTLFQEGARKVTIKFSAIGVIDLLNTCETQYPKA